MKTIMKSLKAFLAFLTVLIIAGGTLLSIAVYKDVDALQKWAPAITACVAILALVNAIVIVVVSDDRARVSNSFEIARRWDEEPVLSARNAIRPLKAAAIPDAMKDSEDVRQAIIHVGNFFWDMAAAIETGWAHSSYLALRFRKTLERLYPALVELTANEPEDSSAHDALKSMTKLRQRWSTPA